MKAGGIDNQNTSADKARSAVDVTHDGAQLGINEVMHVTYCVINAHASPSPSKKENRLR